MSHESKKLKALAIGAFAVALCFALAGCGGSSASSSAAASSGVAVSASSSATSESASLASEEAATEEAELSREMTIDEINIAEGTEISEEEAEEASLADVADDSAAAADKGTATGQGKTSYKMNADYLDKYGNATVLAFADLDGWEFHSMIREHGYVVLDSYAWTRGKTGSFALIDQKGSVVGPYTMKQLDKAGNGKKPAFFMSIVGDYKSAKAALQGMCPMSIEKSAVNKTDDFAVAVVYGPSMERIAVMVQASKQGGFDVYAFGKDYLATGALAKEFGASFTDVNGFWTAFTGAK